ncbi:MAG: transcription termination/antitermination NusG family protein [Bacillota bacterium]|nr:transcription termination/antitermination NusG family protein [Bacillota bacterium]
MLDFQNWYVLFVQTGKEETLCSLLKDSFVYPFSAKFEFYKRVNQKIDKKALFPGYIFCLSNLDQDAFDEWLRKKPVKKGLIKELKYDQMNALTKEEILILNHLLNDKGILTMSKGRKVAGKFQIVEGPLVGMDAYIVKYDSQHKLATLDLFFLNQQWKAGIIEI